MPKREPFEELDSETVNRAVSVFTVWAQAQTDKRKPILEFLDGSTLTPRDLLIELPPGPQSPRSLSGLGQLAARRLLTSQPARAWPRLLNLVAVSAMYGDEDIEEMFVEFESAAGVPIRSLAE